MPNPTNIGSPVCLVGLGRSGTTLVTRIFRRHPDFQALGETSNLIFGTYNTIEQSVPFCGPRFRALPEKDAPREAVYAMLYSLYHSQRPRWFHKPIGIPNIHQDEQARASWYWSAFDILFPNARVFTVLRDPSEVAASSVARWGGTTATMLGRMRSVYNLLLAPQSKLQMVMDFNDFTNSPEKAVEKLLAFAGAAYDKRCLRPFEAEHAPNDKQKAAPEIQPVPQEVMLLHQKLSARIGKTLS
jgi:hypothetical protein